MLTKGSQQRVLQCADCDQPDPMHNADTKRWLASELRASE
jgi:hypothetical protein